MDSIHSTSLGVSLFVSSFLAFCYLRPQYLLFKPSRYPLYLSSLLKKCQNYLRTASPHLTKRDVISIIEDQVQLDEGNRGIGAFILKEELYKAASSIASCHRIAILTGFPCLLDFVIPTETDGPLGALALARALLTMGKEVMILTDECNEEPILAAVSASNLMSQYYTAFQLHSFPGRKLFDIDDLMRLKELSDRIDCVICIERAGPAADGTCRTMRCRDMTDIVAPLELLLPKHDAAITLQHCPLLREYQEASDVKRLFNANVSTIGIGDGGNEVGMGKFLNLILNSDVPNAQHIACVVPADHTITCSVSNWGGYALAASIIIMLSQEEDIASKMASGFVSNEMEVAICQALVNAGARDGIVKKEGVLSVDGMPISISCEVLDDIRYVSTIPKLD